MYILCNRGRLIFVEHIPLIFLYHLRPPLIDFMPDQTSRHYLWFLESYWDHFDISFTTSARTADLRSRSFKSHIKDRTRKSQFGRQRLFGMLPKLSDTFYHIWLFFFPIPTIWICHTFSMHG